NELIALEPRRAHDSTRRASMAGQPKQAVQAVPLSWRTTRYETPQRSTREGRPARGRSSGVFDGPVGVTEKPHAEHYRSTALNAVEVASETHAPVSEFSTPAKFSWNERFAGHPARCDSSGLESPGKPGVGLLDSFAQSYPVPPSERVQPSHIEQ